MTRIDRTPTLRGAPLAEQDAREHSASSRRWIAVSALIALVAVILLLVPGLQSVDLAPGEDLGLVGTSEGAESGSVPSLGTWGADGFRLFATVMIWLVLISVAVLLIGSVFDKRFRPMLFFLLGVFVVCQLAVTLCSGPAEEAEPLAPREGAFEWGELEPVSPGAEMPEAPPATTQMLLLIAVAVSASLTGLAFLVYFKVIRPRRLRSAPPPESDGLEELVAQIEHTVDRLRMGADARESVLACYAEMVRILSRRQQIPYAHLTPREFARSLRRAGLASDHVDRLTGIFEIVRYGHRDDATLATRAIESLESIRAAYATEGP